MRYFTKELMKKSGASEEKAIAESKYQEAFERNFSDNLPVAKELDHLHESDLIFSESIDEDHIIRVYDPHARFEGYKDLVLKNAKVLLDELYGKSLGWQAFEVYPWNEGYEIHCLFYVCGENDFCEFVARCDGVELYELDDFNVGKHNRDMYKTVKEGDFVRAHDMGYWKVLAFRDRYADWDCDDERGTWEKNDIIGKWAIISKAFDSKFQEDKEFTYIDSRWLLPVSLDDGKRISYYFKDHPEYDRAFRNRKLNIEPFEPVVNLYYILVSDKEKEKLAKIIESLPERFSEDGLLDALSQIPKIRISQHWVGEYNFFLRVAAHPWHRNDEQELMFSEIVLFDGKYSAIVLKKGDLRSII